MASISKYDKTSKKIFNINQNWFKGHLHTIQECIPIFAASGHFNYLRLSQFYMQNVSAEKQK